MSKTLTSPVSRPEADNGSNVTLADHAAEVARLVDEGSALHRELADLEKKQERLAEIKAALRAEAKGKTRNFQGTAGAIAMVEQKGQSIARKVEEDVLKRVLRLAGERVWKLFTLHPSKDTEKSFEINAYKILPKRAAQALIETLTGEATPWVRFG